MANKSIRRRKKSKLYMKRLLLNNSLIGRNIRRLKKELEENKLNSDPDVISNLNGVKLNDASQINKPNSNSEVTTNPDGDESQHTDLPFSNTEEKNNYAKENLSNQHLDTGLNPLPRQQGVFKSEPKCCVVPMCSRNEVANPELTFFSMPYELKYRKIWCESIGREDLWDLPATDMTKYYLCSRHFEDKFCFPFQSKLVLLRNARPTLELPSMKGVEFKPRRFEGKCSVVTCESNTKDNPDLKFFYVPYKRENFSTWLRNMGVIDYCTYSVCKFAVCEEHFEKRYIKIDRKGNYVLMPYAEPTLKLPIPYEKIKLIEPPDVRKRSMRRHATPNEQKFENSKTNEDLTSKLQKDATVEFIDFNKIAESLNDPRAKRKKKIYRKYLKSQGNSEEPNNDNFFFDDDNNTDDDDECNNGDPNFVGAEYDSLSEINIKKEAEEFKSINEDQNAFFNIGDTIKIDIVGPFRDVNNSTGEESTKPLVKLESQTSTSVSDLGNVELLINTNDSMQSTKENIKTVYENGSAETRLLFNLCDKYCKEKTASKLQLKEEILLD